MKHDICVRYKVYHDEFSRCLLPNVSLTFGQVTIDENSRAQARLLFDVVVRRETIGGRIPPDPKRPVQKSRGA